MYTEREVFLIYISQAADFYLIMYLEFCFLINKHDQDIVFLGFDSRNTLWLL